MNLKLLVLVNFANSEKIFKWDVENLEEVYCKNSRAKYLEINNLGGNKIDEKDAKKYLKKGRKKLAIWPWEYADSFEGECIEEVCTKSEVDEFCSRQDNEVFKERKHQDALLNQRMERYKFCDKHVSKRVNATKQINKRAKEKQPDKEIEPWKRELSPERLFRGWWEELTKAYKRFCLQDESDCARKCNTEHGTCNLWEDKHEMQKDKTWKYRCECDPGYGPQEDTNTDGSSQYLCAKKISQRDRAKCDTLDYEDGKAITPAILDKHLELPTGGRQKRMVGKYTNFANNYFLPAVVDIFHQTVPVDMSQSSCLFKGTSSSNNQSSAPRKRSYNHQCGGTLLVLNDGSDQNWSNKVYTASHCFCKLGFDRRCGWAPDPKHFFVRIGLIDNTKALNPTWTKDYPEKLIQPKDDDEYIDVRVTNIKLQATGYLENYCDNVEENGEDDIAIMTLERKIDLSKLQHVKPACNYKDYAVDITAFQGDNKWKSNLDCYAGGWGQAQSESGLGLSDRMKFAKVEILNPEECQRNIKNDGFLANMIQSEIRDSTGEWPVICAGGFSDGEGGISNTAGGDSGGGLYCFDKDNESTYYFMGALHGGNEDATKDRYMYFSNNAYQPYSKL